MRYAVIENGAVENVIVADPGFALDGKILVQSDTAQVGFLYDGHAFTDPNPPAPPGSVVPSPVTALQARLALNQAGLRSSVETWVTGASSDVQDYWHYAAEIHRDHPIIAQAMAALNISSDQMDALFRAAAAL